MGEAFALGAVAQISLLLSGLFATWITVPSRIVGWLGGFGAGALMSAVAFDLVKQAEALGGPGLVAWLLTGAAIFILGDYAVDRLLGSSGTEGGALGIVLGAIVDGVPESLIFGTSLAVGLGVSPAFLAAVIVSNVPQALAPSAELAAGGWSRGEAVRHVGHRGGRVRNRGGAGLRDWRSRWHGYSGCGTGSWRCASNAYQLAYAVLVRKGGTTGGALDGRGVRPGYSAARRMSYSRIVASVADLGTNGSAVTFVLSILMQTHALFNTPIGEDLLALSQRQRFSYIAS
jgi:hypothetical protein